MNGIMRSFKKNILICLIFKIFFYNLKSNLYEYTFIVTYRGGKEVVAEEGVVAVLINA